MFEEYEYTPTDEAYRVRLCAKKLREYNMDNEQWRDTLDLHLGWEKWRLHKKTGGYTYVLFPDEEQTFFAVTALSHCMTRFPETGKFYDRPPGVVFKPRDRAPKPIKRVTQTLVVEFTGDPQSVYKPSFMPPHGMVEDAVRALIQGEFSLRRVEEGKGTATYEVTTDDPRAASRLHYTGHRVEGVPGLVRCQVKEPAG